MLGKVEICGVNTAKLPSLSAQETDELLRRVKEGDQSARERLVEGNLRLVLSVIQRFSNRGENADDLFQVGCMGLIKAIDNFDVTMNVKFSTYAVPMIAGEIKRFLRDDGIVKVSRTLKENGWKVRQAAEAVAKKYGRDATIQEVAQLTGMASEDIVMAMESGVEVESIYRTVYQSDGNEIMLVDRLPAEGDENEKVLNRMMLGQLLSELGAKERELINLRYFEDKTQVEVAKRLGISQVQVSRMEKKILLQMRSLAK